MARWALPARRKELRNDRKVRRLGQGSAIPALPKRRRAIRSGYRELAQPLLGSASQHSSHGQEQMKKRTFTPTQHELETEGLPSASSFNADFRCLGRRALVATLPAMEDSAQSARGTRIHKALEASDLEGLSDSDARTASRIMYGESELVHEHDFEGAVTTFEERFWDVADDLTPIWSARIDRHDWQSNKKRLLVTDNKTGWSLGVPIEENWQIKAEASLLAEQYSATEVVAALIHPHHPDSLYEVATYSGDELPEILDSVRHNVKLIQSPDQPRTVGGIQCQFCPAKRICPEYQAASAKLKQAIADEIEDEGFTALLRRSIKERGAHVKALKE